MVLNKYRDCDITRVLVMRRPLSSFAIRLLNFVTFGKMNFELENIRRADKNFQLYHPSMIVEIELSNGFKKLIYIDKDTNINIKDGFENKFNSEIIPYCLDNKIKLGELFDKTRSKMGTIKFFNWNIYKNNCQTFTKELMKTLGIAGIRKLDFLYQNRNFFKKKMKLSELSFYIFNIIHNITVMFENSINYGMVSKLQLY
tara:strand:+ start:3104 stop:3703 length:600 start_codon:yes stop_codon:yes gene_type:complete